MASNLIGLEDLLSKLSNIAGNEAIMKGVEKSCLRVEATAKENCPVDTGLLRASIDHKLDPSTLSGTVFTNLKYAPSVEFGSKSQGVQAFLYPAVAENKENIIKDISDALKEAIGK